MFILKDNFTLATYKSLALSDEQRT